MRPSRQRLVFRRRPLRLPRGRRDLHPVKQRHAARPDGEDVGQRAPLDAEARVVLLRLQHQERGERAEHAVLDRQVDRLLLERGRQVAILRGDRVALFDDARDPCPHPGALEERPRRRRQRARERHRRARHLQAKGDLGGKIGVDEELVTRLDAVDHARPDPPGAVDGDGDPRARRAQQTTNGDRRLLRAVEHQPVLGEPRGHQTREHHVVANSADRHHVQPAHPHRGERDHARPQLVGADLAGGGHAVGDQQDPHRPPLDRLDRRRQRGERAIEIGGAESPAGDDALADDTGGAARPAAPERHHVLIERRHGDRRVTVLAQLCQQPVDRGGLVAEAERPRRAGVDQDLEVANLLARRGLGEGDDARHHQVVVAQAEAAAGDLMRQLEVGVGCEVAPLEPRLGLPHVVERADRQRPQARQPPQRQAIGLTGTRQLLRIRDDDLLGRRRRDREHARRKLVARLGLQQRRVLLVVQEVFVGDARRLLLDDLPLLPALADPHREPADRRAGRQRDPEAPLAHPVLRVAEGQVQLGEGERIVDRRVGRQRHQLEAGAVGCGQADGRRRRDDDAPRPRRVAGDEGDETQDQETGQATCRGADCRGAEFGGHTGPDARPAISI